MASLGKIIEGTLNEKLLFKDAKILLERQTTGDGRQHVSRKPL